MRYRKYIIYKDLKEYYDSLRIGFNITPIQPQTRILNTDLPDSFTEDLRAVQGISFQDVLREELNKIMENDLDQLQTPTGRIFGLGLSWDIEKIQ